jgi:tetratricopeptide (TPR) repeat protein
MKRLVIFFTAILFCTIVVAQKPYDPLTDPIVQQPANPALFLEQMRATRRLEILQGTEYTRAEFQAFLDDFTKANAWRSTTQKVVVRNTLGNDFEIDKKYEEAIKLYYWVVWNKNDCSHYHTEDPIVGFYYFKTCYDLGRLLSKMGEYKSSYEFYTTAVDFYKTDSSLYFAAVTGMKGVENKSLLFADYSSSISKMINKAIELKPGSGLYVRTRAEFYLNHLKDTTRALADFNKAVQLNPKDDNAYFYMAVINFLQHKYPGAIKNITNCIKINSKKEGYPYYRAVIYKELKDYAAAITDYTTAITLYGTDADYYKDRGYCYFKRNNIAAAYDDYGFATMLNPKDEDSKGNLKILDPLLKEAYEKMGFTPPNAYPFFLKIADTLSEKKKLWSSSYELSKMHSGATQKPRAL